MRPVITFYSEAGAVLAKSDSHDGLAQKLQVAIDDKHPKGNSYDSQYVHDVFPKKVVHSISKQPGKLFASPYSINDGGEVQLGDPKEVERAYKPVQESHTAERGPVLEVTRFQEAQFDKNSGKLTVRIIQPGFNTSSTRYYPKSTLVRDHKIFEGAKMFANHQTKQEAQARPEGDVRDWVANVTKTWAEKDGTIMGSAIVHDPSFKDKLAGLQESGLLSEMGVSIRAAGMQQEAEVEGKRTMYVESFVLAKSVDFVTYPGAGGIVMAMESDSSQDIDLITPAQLATRRPDLVNHFSSAAQEAAIMDKTVEQLTRELQESNARATQLEKEMNEAKKQAAITTTATALATMLAEAKLPEVAAKRIQAQFLNAEKVDGMKEAIVSEADYLKAIGYKAPADTTAKFAPGVRGMGATQEASTTNIDDARKKLIKSWQATGMSEAEAEIAVSYY